MMDMALPGIVVTGASGFVGRHFLETAADQFRLFCLARRSQQEAGIPKNKNIVWSQVDIGIWDTLRPVVSYIKKNGGADYVLHLAAYYDFGNADNLEYERTNIKGTRNVLKLAQQIGTARFIFASSLAACEFPKKGSVVDETSLADARFPYARSKRAGEEMMKDYSEWFPCTIFRLAAVFSDWCEYPILYRFLSAWLSGSWRARILGGKGESSVTYIHVQDLVKLFLKVIEKSNDLPKLCTYIASPSGSVSHMELFGKATRYFYGQEIKPIRMRKPLAILGVAVRQGLGRMVRSVPFERLWMMKYIDRKLIVDASRTHSELGWKPVPRYMILRRLPFLIQKMKNHGDAWRLRNEEVARRISERPHLKIYQAMVEAREDLAKGVLEYLTAPDQRHQFPKHQEMNKDFLKWYVTLIYHLTATMVRTRDRALMQSFARVISFRSFVQGFEVQEVCAAISSAGEVIARGLETRLAMTDAKQRIYDHITMSFQLMVDEIEDAYEMVAARAPESPQPAMVALKWPDSLDLEDLVHQLEDISQDALEDRLSREIKKLHL